MNKKDLDQYAEHLQTLEIQPLCCVDCGKELSKNGYIIDKNKEVRCIPCYNKKHPQKQKSKPK